MTQKLTITDKFLVAAFSILSFYFFIKFHLGGSASYQRFENQERLGNLAKLSGAVRHKSNDRIDWVYLDAKNLDIYNSDQVYTGEGSQAVVELDNQTKITINEKTLIKFTKNLLVDEVFEVLSGLITLNIPKGKKIRVKVGGQSLVLLSKGQDAQVKLNKYDSKITVESKAEIEVVSIESAAGDLSYEKNSVEIIKPKAFQIEQMNLARGSTQERERQDTSFSFRWSTDRPNEKVILQVSLQENFNEVIEKEVLVGDSSLVMNLQEPGRYYWRLSSIENGDVSSVQSFEWHFLEPINWNIENKLFLISQKPVAEFKFNFDKRLNNEQVYWKLINSQTKSGIIKKVDWNSSTVIWDYPKDLTEGIYQLIFNRGDRASFVSENIYFLSYLVKNQKLNIRQRELSIELNPLTPLEEISYQLVVDGEIIETGFLESYFFARKFSSEVDTDFQIIDRDKKILFSKRIPKVIVEPTRLAEVKIKQIKMQSNSNGRNIFTWQSINLEGGSFSIFINGSFYKTVNDHKIEIGNLDQVLKEVGQADCNAPECFVLRIEAFNSAARRVASQNETFQYKTLSKEIESPIDSINRKSYDKGLLSFGSGFWGSDVESESSRGKIGVSYYVSVGYNNKISNLFSYSINGEIAGPREQNNITFSTSLIYQLEAAVSYGLDLSSWFEIGANSNFIYGTEVETLTSSLINYSNLFSVLPEAYARFFLSPYQSLHISGGPYITGLNGFRFEANYLYFFENFRFIDGLGASFILSDKERDQVEDQNQKFILKALYQF